MFRASPWISYDPTNRHPLLDLDDDAIPFEPPSSQQEHYHITHHDMDAPEISTLREEEEEESSPPPETSTASFAKFRVSLRGPSWGQGSASNPAIGPPVCAQPPGRRGISPDSDDEDEEDQLIDDDELAIVTETGRAQATSSPASMVSVGNPVPPPGSPRKRGGVPGIQVPRHLPPGRRGRPGREPPGAAAMMSTFEVTKGDQPAATAPKVIPPAPVIIPDPPPPGAGPSTTSDWTTSTPPKPPRKKPGPKKGTTLGPRGPRKNPPKTAQNTPGTSTPLLDDSLPTDPSTFLVPAPPSIPPTPGPDQLPLPSSHLPPILPPDFILDPAVPVPAYPLPTRAFPVQPPPKVPTGYAPTHPVDPKRAPARKWTIMQREIKGIGGGRWFTRTWVTPQSVAQPTTRPSSPPAPPDVVNAVVSPPQMPPQSGVTRVSASARAEAGAAQALLELDRVDPARWPTAVQDPPEGGLSSRGPASPHSRSNSSPPPLSPGATVEVQARPS